MNSKTLCLEEREDSSYLLLIRKGFKFEYTHILIIFPEIHTSAQIHPIRAEESDID